MYDYGSQRTTRKFAAGNGHIFHDPFLVFRFKRNSVNGKPFLNMIVLDSFLSSRRGSCGLFFVRIRQLLPLSALLITPMALTLCSQVRRKRLASFHFRLRFNAVCGRISGSELRTFITLSRFVDKMNGHARLSVHAENHFQRYYFVIQ